MVTTTYVFLVLAVALQRLVEVRVSRANEALLEARGAVQHAARQMPIMVAVHSAWLISCLAEVWLFDRPVHRGLLFVALLTFCAGQALRLCAMHALGARWTVKVLTVPREPPIDAGVFRFVRHPNYLGVILEVAALPLIHSAYLTAVLFSIGNGVLLYHRIRAEEQALAANGDYETRLGQRPRLVPDIVRALRDWRKRVPAHGE
jgi:methyltransferase